MARNIGNGHRISPPMVVPAPLAVILAVRIHAIFAIVGAVVVLAFLLTGLVGFCPVYGLIGFSTCRTR